MFTKCGSSASDTLSCGESMSTSESIVVSSITASLALGLSGACIDRYRSNNLGSEGY